MFVLLLIKHWVLTNQSTHSVLSIFYFLFIYLSRGIQFSRASLNGALTKHKNKDIETIKLGNQ